MSEADDLHVLNHRLPQPCDKNPGEDDFRQEKPDGAETDPAESHVPPPSAVVVITTGDGLLNDAPTTSTNNDSCHWLLPHGGYSLIPAVLTTMAWIAALFQDGCDFARFHSNSTATMDALATNPDTPWLEVGFAAYREPVYNSRRDEWETVYSGPCLAYPEDMQPDAIWIVAKTAAFVSLVLGGGGTFFLWFSTCCIFSPGSWRWAGYQVLAASIFQAIAFCWFRTSLCTADANNCAMFWGANADILASVLFFLAAVACLVHYPIPPFANANDDLLLTTMATASRTIASDREDGPNRGGNSRRQRQRRLKGRSSRKSRRQTYDDREYNDEENHHAIDARNHSPNPSTTMSPGQDSGQNDTPQIDPTENARLSHANFL